MHRGVRILVGQNIDPPSGGASTERLVWHPVDHQLQVDVVVRPIEQVDYIELGLKLYRKNRRVLRPNPKRDERTGIAEHGVADEASRFSLLSGWHFRVNRMLYSVHAFLPQSIAWSRFFRSNQREHVA